jgi:hypothetical protein
MSCVGFTFQNGASELFENGSSVGTTTGCTIGTNTLNFEIGNNTIPHPWSGGIQEVRIYNRVLSRNEIMILSRRPGIAYELAPRRRVGVTDAATFLPSWVIRQNVLIGGGLQ